MTEALMMMKEHVTEQYKAIKFTIGNGCSGGSINSNMNASINPVLLDGISISIAIACACPDSETVTVTVQVSNCVSLPEAYQKPQWLALMTTAGCSASQMTVLRLPPPRPLPLPLIMPTGRPACRRT